MALRQDVARSCKRSDARDADQVKLDHRNYVSDFFAVTVAAKTHDMPRE